MVGKQQFENGFSVFAQFGRVCFNNHTVSRLSGTGRVYRAAFVFENAHSARAVNGKFGVVAERGDIYAGFSRYFQNIAFAVYFDGFAVDSHEFLIHSNSPLSRRTDTRRDTFRI